MTDISIIRMQVKGHNGRRRRGHYVNKRIKPEIVQEVKTWVDAERTNSRNV